MFDSEACLPRSVAELAYCQSAVALLYTAADIHCCTASVAFSHAQDPGTETSQGVDGHGVTRLSFVCIEVGYPNRRCRAVGH